MHFNVITWKPKKENSVGEAGSAGAAEDAEPSLDSTIFTTAGSVSERLQKN